MDTKDWERVTKVVGGVVGQTETQVMALFISTWGALAKERSFDGETVRDVLDQADKQIAVGAPRGMIDQMRRQLFPPH